MRNSTNEVAVHRLDASIQAGYVPVLGFVCCANRRAFFVQATDVSARNDFGQYEFNEATVADPQNGTIALIDLGEYDVTLYESATYSNDPSTMTALWNERGVVCA